MSSMSNATAPIVENPIIVDLSTTYGGVLVGISLSSIIYGISCLQTFIYSMHCDTDSKYMKLLIAVLWLADTANQLTLIIGAWPVLIRQYGRIAGLSVIQPPLLVRNFCRALYTVIHSNGAQFPSAPRLGIVYLVKGIGKPLAVLGAPTEINVGTVLRASAVAIDVFLAGGMMYLLKRTSPHFTGSKKIIQRLLIITVGSGTLTAICAAFIVMLVRATLLVNLNSRNYVKNGGNYAESGSDVHNTSTLVIRGISRSQSSDVFVQVDRETSIKMDELDSFGSAPKA
ncbi:hypothetical protein HYPSUDRAFT_201929 [Hypholoma sublateritium FD-334 SS-4]|uniref:DUF6534 domain-containing protein n=1 Tax=Hypholoma sublateritium (strain FD-334 SS-4) TaxID=945553 RepID=A0A0D2MGU3_HYPSF|nr:hypothetical protein HYPSUDRAFT_201929 [Hypholoma sublateritium FD-334 SS-4]